MRQWWHGLCDDSEAEERWMVYSRDGTEMRKQHFRLKLGNAELRSSKK